MVPTPRTGVGQVKTSYVDGLRTKRIPGFYAVTYPSVRDKLATLLRHKKLF